MSINQVWISRLRFMLSVSALYILSLGAIVYALQPGGGTDNARSLAYLQSKAPTPPPHVIAISGIPDRIVIPSEQIDLPVVVGYFDSSVDAWTLSGYKAEYANTSAPANNIGGNTYIYGHNNDYVFGALRRVTPTVGAEALVYTTNGHIFAYKFVSVSSVDPSDVSALTYSGPPILMIQTCTGSLNEWRTLYRFNYSEIVQ